MTVVELLTGLLLLLSVLGAGLAVDKGLGLSAARKRSARMVDDWLGAPARLGFDPVPGFPERMSLVERQTAELAAATRQELAGRLVQLSSDVSALSGAAGHSDTALAAVVRRLDDQGRAVTELRLAVARVVQALEDIRARSLQVRRTDPPGTTPGDTSREH